MKTSTVYGTTAIAALSLTFASNAYAADPILAPQSCCWSTSRPKASHRWS
jgi:hypothetical protein